MNIAIGTDIEEIKRFENKTDKRFLDHIFTQREMDYCFSKGKPAQHLCARFCAKEATIKALTDFNIKDVYYNDIEILNKETGLPYIEIQKHPELTIKVTLSHCKTHAVANVLIM